MARLMGEAYKVVEATRTKGDYRGAVVGCGRMGSTIDDEHIHMAHYPWPWAHAPATGCSMAAVRDRTLTRHGAPSRDNAPARVTGRTLA